MFSERAVTTRGRGRRAAPRGLPVNVLQVEQARRGGTPHGAGLGNKSANLHTRGEAYYPGVIIMQTDRRQVGRVDKSVSSRDVMS